MHKEYIFKRLKYLDSSLYFVCFALLVCVCGGGCVKYNCSLCTKANYRWTCVCQRSRMFQRPLIFHNIFLSLSFCLFISIFLFISPSLLLSIHSIEKPLIFVKTHNHPDSVIYFSHEASCGQPCLYILTNSLQLKNTFFLK